MVASVTERVETAELLHAAPKLFSRQADSACNDRVWGRKGPAIFSSQQKVHKQDAFVSLQDKVRSNAFSTRA